MSSSLRKALGPIRRNLTDELNKQPGEAANFDSAEDRDAHFRVLRAYRERLVKKSERFVEMHKRLTSTDYEDEAEQAAVDQIAESDATILARLDDVMAAIDAAMTDIREQQELELSEVRRQDELRIFQEQSARRLAQPQVPIAPIAANPQHPVSVRLPKLELIKFNGDILRWNEFWDSFDVSVHRNTSLQPIEKLNYLKAQLIGEARRSISGLAVSNDNYDQAIKMLKDRFGRKQTVIDAHYKALTELAPSTNHLLKLRSTFDFIEQHLNSLAALGQDIEHEHFVSLIRSKLPSEVILRLEETFDGDSWEVKTLRERLHKHLAARQLAEGPSNHKYAYKMDAETPVSRGHSSSGTSTAGALVSATRGRPQRRTCAYCGGNHWSDECSKYSTLSARKTKIKGHCYCCLQPGHDIWKCRSQKGCFYCKKKQHHHSSLCPTKFGPAPTESAQVASEVTATVTVAADTVTPSQEGTLLSSGETTILQTAKTVVKSTDSSETTTIRLLFDTGSQRSYISAHLAQLLRLKPKRKETLSVLTFGSQSAKKIESNVVDIRVKLLDGSFMHLSANIVPNITGSLQRSPINVDKLNHALYKSLPLADSLPYSAEDMRIELLIGSDYFWEFIEPEKLEISKGLYLVASKLGWLLSGRQPARCVSSPPVSALFVSQMIASESSLSSFSLVDPEIEGKLDIAKLWDLETIGIKDRVNDFGDEEALTHFNETVQFRDGRYFVSWPWKEAEVQLPTNFKLALGRLNSLVRRYKDDSEFFNRYQSVLDCQLTNGMIERVDDMPDSSTLKHYLPHHAVLTPEKATTKLRIVYDGSAKAKRSDPSLNDCLLRGPVFLEDVGSLLIRFRLRPVALVADIEKAFLQIGLNIPDRDVTRFLWLKDPSIMATDQNLAVYRFTRVPFGIISSPFLLSATLNYHLAKDGSDVASQISRDIYVDNIITGVESNESAIEFFAAAKGLFGRASMNVRQWASNSPTVLEQLPQSERVSTSIVSALGYSWNISDDTIVISAPSKLISPDFVTKRQVLKFIASFYDPLGLFSPVFVPAKLYLQQLWLLKLDWDEGLSAQQSFEWSSITSAVMPILQTPFPRYIGVTSGVDTNRYILHCFCDAPQRAYGACVYLYIETNAAQSCHLVFSKARLAPLNGITLPRLELLAVHIGSKAMAFVEKSLCVSVARKVLWTDSQCVLHWLHSKKPLSVFVQNRVSDVKKVSNVEYRYVPSLDNPADLASRGTTALDLSNNRLWWNGPKWLSSNTASWPSIDFLGNIDYTVHEEIAKEETHLLLVTPEDAIAKEEIETPFHIDYEKASSFTRLLRITAYAARFIRIMKTHQRPGSGSLSADEINAAKMLWVKYVQRKHYADALTAMADKRKHPIVDQFDLWIDEEGLLRCGGRLTNAALPEITRHPLLLPKDDHLTKLIICNFHEKLFHVGVAHTLSEIRKQYWIPAGRARVFKYIHSCVRCKRFDGGPYKVPTMPAFPKCRVTASPAFTFTGLDYLGPLNVKNGGKVWICIMTCLATRAVHLEVVPDMTATEFLLALRRFISRRGKPSAIWSDNAAQFKLAQSAISDVWENVIRDRNILTYVSDNGINWHFIIEQAPWRGGFYERLIRIVKQCMRKTLGKLRLSLTQLQTVAAEIEAVINSRPLTYVGSDLDFGQILTPAHFLSLNVSTSPPIMDGEELKDANYIQELSSKDGLIATWKKGQKHLDCFWKLWHEQYLLGLRERSQRELKQPRIRSPKSPAKGDVVLIKADAPRGSWKLARVIEVLTDADGEFRSAKLMLPTGNVISRSLMHLYPLECEDKELPEVSPLNAPVGDHVTLIESKERPHRSAAKQASQKIKQILLDEELSE